MTDLRARLEQLLDAFESEAARQLNDPGIEWCHEQLAALLREPPTVVRDADDPRGNSVGNCEGAICQDFSPSAGCDAPALLREPPARSSGLCAVPRAVIPSVPNGGEIGTRHTPVFDEFCPGCITMRWCAFKGDCLAEKALPARAAAPPETPDV